MSMNSLDKIKKKLQRQEVLYKRVIKILKQN